MSCRTWTLVLLLAAVCPLCGQDPPPAPVAPGELEGRLTYARLTDGKWRIWEADLATQTTWPLHDAGEDARLPAVRADGSVTWHTVTQAVWVSDGGDAGPSAALEELWPARDPVWSPDGRHVVFTRVRTDLIDAMNIWVADRDGGDPRTLTTEPGVQCHPSWSPDGRRIVFSSGHGWGSYEIWTIGRDGTGRTRLTKDRKHDFYPAWSPDGKRIAWSTDRSGDYEIWLMDPDGANPRRLTRTRGLDTRPAWSPDGGHIAFASSRLGRLRIWVMRADGSDQRPLDFLGDNACDPCWAPARPKAAERPPSPPQLTLKGVGASPKEIRPQQGEETTIRYSLDRPASVEIDVVDRFGVLARRLDLGRVEPGVRSAVWDGTAFDDAPVPPDVYRYVIRAETEEGQVVVHDPSRSTGGEELKPRDFTWDEKKRCFRWTMPRAGFARMRVGLRQFPHLGNLLDWEPMTAGRKEVWWDGRDGSGLVRLADHPDKSVVLWLYAMPDNTVIVRGPGSGRRLAGPAVHPPMVHGEGTYYHARHDPGTCGPIRHEVTFPGSHERDGKGSLVLSGKVPVKVAIDPRDRARVLAARYEIAVYVDLQFLFEEEDGVDPFTFTWDTTTLTPGEHVLTVDLLAYDDHFGVTTEQVVIRPPTRGGSR